MTMVAIGQQKHMETFNSVTTVKSYDSDVHQSTKLFQKWTLSTVFINNIREISSIGQPLGKFSFSKISFLSWRMNFITVKVICDSPLK